MEILLRAIFIALSLLIRIGDFVIFIIKLFSIVPNKISSFFKSIFQKFKIKSIKYKAGANRRRQESRQSFEIYFAHKEKLLNRVNYFSIKKIGRFITNIKKLESRLNYIIRTSLNKAFKIVFKLFIFLLTIPFLILKKLYALLKLIKKIQITALRYLIGFTIITIRKVLQAIKTVILGFFYFLLFPFKFLIRGKKAFNENIFPVKKSFKTHKKPITIFPATFLIKMKYFSLGFTFSLIFIFLPLLFFIFVQDLPSPKELSLRQIAQTTKIYDRNGILLYQIYASQNRTIVPLSSIPKNFINATIAIEDKDFYNHPGFDVSAIIRSAYKDLSGEGLQGGSTITQQLIKSALLTPETSMTRKIKEVIIAFWAERIYTKDEILAMYFNQVPYGGTAWGVEAASEVYFGKSVKDLTLAESAFLAGIPKAPTIYSPFGQYPDLWKKRQKEVLNRMTLLGYISQQQANDALNEELDFKSPRIPIRAPHFVMYVKDQLTKKYGLSAVEKGGLSVYTSLDLNMQEKVQQIVTAEVENNQYLNLTNGAAVVTSPTNGDILAMVGSRDFSYPGFGNVNVATSLRQPGSSIKVVTYSAALSKNFTAASILDDSPVSFPDGTRPYSPVNYDGKFHGKVPIRLALANSFNIPAVKLLNQIGIPEMVSLGRKMGIKSWGEANQYGLSITLGGAEATMLDMASVYGVLANKGIKAEPNPFIKITDIKGNILEEKTDKGWNQILADEKGNNKFISYNTGTRVLDEGVTFIISSILSDNSARSLAFSSNSPLNIPGKTVSVKTGTSDNKKDNWTIGYTPNYVVTVWVGNNDGAPMSQHLASGITGAAPIWNKIMNTLLINTPNTKLEPPTNVITKPCFGRIEYFIRGTENSVSCNLPKPTPKKEE